MLTLMLLIKLVNDTYNVQKLMFVMINFVSQFAKTDIRAHLEIHIFLLLCSMY